MKTFKKILVLSMFVLAILSFGSRAYAMIPTLSLSANSGDNVSITVYGDPNANVTFYYNITSSLQSRSIGSTNSGGYFSTNLSASSYGILSGSLVYVVVNNQQSQSVTWPYYSNYYPYGSNLGLNISGLTLYVGDTATITSANSSTLYVSSNSNPNIASASSSSLPIGCTGSYPYSTVTGQPCYYGTVNTGSIIIKALSVGTDNITICQSNYSSSCSTISVTVTGGNTYYSPTTTYYSPAQTFPTVAGASVDASCYFSRYLRYGSSGSDVYCLQSYLYAKGYFTDQSMLNSYFDENTRSAVMRFQQDNYLRVDGIVGSATRARLINY